MTGRGGGAMHGGKMRGNSSVRVKAVHRVEVGGKLRRLMRQIGGAPGAAAGILGGITL